MLVELEMETFPGISAQHLNSGGAGSSPFAGHAMSPASSSSGQQDQSLRECPLTLKLNVSFDFSQASN
jgi:hypothetical protein